MGLCSDFLLLSKAVKEAHSHWNSQAVTASCGFPWQPEIAVPSKTHLQVLQVGLTYGPHLSQGHTSQA